MIITLLILGLLGGFLSGMLGVGGAVIMIPLMLTVPPLVGAGELTMTEVAGLSMIQVLVSSVSGMIIHKKNNFVNGRVLVSVGIPMGIFALFGAYLSKHMGDRILLLFFGFLVLVAFIMLLLKKEKNEVSTAPAEEFQFRLIPSLLIGAFVGFMSGAVGAGGGFILIPLMVTVLRVPLKVTVGTSLGIVFIGALTGSIGKILSMQVSLMTVIPLIIGSIPAAQLGAKCSKAMKPSTVRYLLLAVVFLSAAKVWWKILAG
ncbi:MAG: sulfite exporter TauE/SafE family protein [Kiritimatiellales bacterium]